MDTVMPVFSMEPKPRREATAGMTPGAALAWAVVDLHLAFWQRITQVVTETSREWRKVRQAQEEE